MSEFDSVQVVALLAWLILAGSALASYKLSWKSSIKMALAWTCVFTGLALAISWLGLA